MHNIPLLSLIYNLINDHQSIRKRTASGEIELPINIKGALNTISKGIIDIDKVKSYEDLVEEITTAEEKKKALNNIINIPVSEYFLNVFADNFSFISSSFHFNFSSINHIVASLAVFKFQNEFDTHGNSQGLNFPGYAFSIAKYGLPLNKITNIP